MNYYSSGIDKKTNKAYALISPDIEATIKEELIFVKRISAVLDKEAILINLSNINCIF